MFGRFGEVFISYLACCDKLRKMRLLMWRCCIRARLGTPITCWSGLPCWSGAGEPRILPWAAPGLGRTPADSWDELPRGAASPLGCFAGAVCCPLPSVNPVLGAGRS